jgi:chromosome segregation ATPase
MNPIKIVKNVLYFNIRYDKYVYEKSKLCNILKKLRSRNVFKPPYFSFCTQIKRELESRIQETSSLQSQISALESQQSQAKLASSSEEQKLAKTNQKLAAAEEKVSQLEQKLDTAHARAADQTKTNEELRAQLDELKGNLAEKQRSLDQR